MNERNPITNTEAKELKETYDGEYVLVGVPIRTKNEMIRLLADRDVAMEIITTLRSHSGCLHGCQEIHPPGQGACCVADRLIAAVEGEG